jgi:hypothetical protein
MSLFPYSRYISSIYKYTIAFGLSSTLFSSSLSPDKDLLNHSSLSRQTLNIPVVTKLCRHLLRALLGLPKNTLTHHDGVFLKQSDTSNPTATASVSFPFLSTQDISPHAKAHPSTPL